MTWIRPLVSRSLSTEDCADKPEFENHYRMHGALEQKCEEESSVVKHAALPSRAAGAGRGLEMTWKPKTSVVLTALATAIAFVTACSDASSADPEDPGSGGDGGDGGLPQAFLLSTQLLSNDGGRFDLHYVLDSLDSQTVDASEGLQTSASHSFVHGGDVYIATEEDRVLTRYEIDADNRFVPGPRIGFSGVVVNNFRQTWEVVSDTRAFAIDMTLGSSVVVEWNPTTMEIVDRLELDFDELVRDGFAPVALDVYHTADELVIPVAWFDNVGIDGYFSSAIIRIPFDDWSRWEIVEDDRCGMAVQVGAMSDGDLVLAGDQYFGQFYLYGPQQQESCFLRVTASDGVAAFDPDFQLQVFDISGDQPLYNMNVFNDTLFFTTLILDRLTSDPEDPGTHWGGVYCALWSGTPGDLSSFRERPDLQSEPGSCDIPVGAANGVTYMETGVNWPNIGPVSLREITDDGLGSRIGITATNVDNLKRIR